MSVKYNIVIKGTFVPNFTEKVAKYIPYNWVYTNNFTVCGFDSHTEATEFIIYIARYFVTVSSINVTKYDAETGEDIE